MMKRRELEKDGVHVDHVPRHETWLRAHSKEKDGVRIFNNPKDQEVANAIVRLFYTCNMIFFLSLFFSGRITCFIFEF